jgi:general stress protein 26
MDSIDQLQEEENRKDLNGAEAIKQIKEMAEDAKTCFLCTNTTNGGSIGTRPMTVQKVDEEGNLWFLSANDSHTNTDISRDSSVQLYFQGSPFAGFLHLTGQASISDDRTKIEEFWSPMLKTWFTGGIDDPRISVIKVTPEDGYYWDNKHGQAVAFVKIIVGALTGRTMDDSITGKIAP